MRRSDIIKKPSFLITIDTEGDNLWSRPKQVTTENARYLPRFQALCEKYGFKPTYLTNHEMALDRTFQSFAAAIIKRETGEVGMHLHAWNSPPLYELTAEDSRLSPYLVEYPKDIIEQKVQYMTQLLEKIFPIKVCSHRAGRWNFNEAYAQILIKNGYRVDCSVTPGVSWKTNTDDKNRSEGQDYTNFPDKPYFIDPDDISKAGGSPLLEVPVTIRASCGVLHSWKALAQRLFFPNSVTNLNRACWLRPNGKNLNCLLKLTKLSLDEKRDYLEFALHSSELMPGGSPVFPNERKIEKLYDDLEALFCEVRKYFVGRTLKEYYAVTAQNRI